MKDRIKQIRKSNKLTQQEFADRLGVGRSSIASYESGEREPISAVVALICREFDVSEDWLRYGTGPMKRSVSREEEIAALVASTLNGSNEFKKAVIQAICRRTDKELEALESLLREIYNSLEKEKGQDES